MIKIEKVLIHFYDNDFYFTWSNVLNTLAEAIKQGFVISSKEEFLKILNEMGYNHYVLFQNKGEHEHDEKHLRNYITIKKVEHILLNDEVTEYLSKTKWNNSESHYLLMFNENNTYSFQIRCI